MLEKVGPAQDDGVSFCPEADAKAADPAAEWLLPGPVRDYDYVDDYLGGHEEATVPGPIAACRDAENLEDEHYLSHFVAEMRAAAEVAAVAVHAATAINTAAD